MSELRNIQMQHVTGELHQYQASGSTTPTGLQSTAEITRRRFVMTVLNVITFAAFMWLAAGVFSIGGWSVLDGVLMLCLAATLPWAVVGFWNSLVGFALLHFTKNPMQIVAPYAGAAQDTSPLEMRTAILMTLRNEDPTRALARLKTVKKSLDQTRDAAAFDYFILSDTTDELVAKKEEQLVEAWRSISGLQSRIVYRRRVENTGYKAGNVRDFCSRWGGQYEFMLPLDADSLMSGVTIVKLVRMMQAHPKIGLLQSLVVGTPSESAFARIFQFGMRHGMRTYTMGQAWWAADCGPFWGHNALVRIKPFYESCELPEVAGKGAFAGHVLSHDQVEATLMRRAGWEVHVWPVEAGSWEDNPPTVLEYAKREQRWCQGNLQYLRLLKQLNGLKPMSRFQLVWAILMFASLPTGLIATGLLPFAVMEAQGIADFPIGLATALYVAYIVMFMMPKLAGFFDVALSGRELRRYGGGLRFAAGVLIETLVSFLQSATTTVQTAVFMVVLALTGRSITWGGQQRDAHELSWKTATRQFWPQTVFGAYLLVSLAWLSPVVLAWTAPFVVSYLLVVPYAVLSASPRLGRWMKQVGLCGVPEDFRPKRELVSVGIMPLPRKTVSGAGAPANVAPSDIAA